MRKIAKETLPLKDFLEEAPPAPDLRWTPGGTKPVYCIPYIKVPG